MPRPGGAPTLSGHMFLARGAKDVPDDTRETVSAAAGFPRISGATVLHLHTRDGTRLVVDDQVLTAAEFHAQKIPLLNLTPGQPVIIVGCNAVELAQELAARDGR